ncbi:CRISPR system precrRNA processing endoribonuclease RAMP protein Cas6 [Aliarcobacter lanthieri]|uniref:CRISPR system precrRNA processing endoribonuclease RAMP protein Cas6 n=1 Tax=Aliarcobacter lanthieri TaxID=1355374 RepID=UPI003AAA3926
MRYIKITIKINSSYKPPYFLGSQLRGAFGYALKKVVCINPSYECNDCFASSSCLFYQFYEEKNAFHKFRFDFHLAQNSYIFDYYLFDSATKDLPYILSAFIKMLKENGLGKDKIKYEDFDIFINDELATKQGNIKIPKDFIKVLEIGDIKENIELVLVTPLRIKKDNRFLRSDEIELENLINSIYQRQLQLLGKPFRKFPYQIQGEIIEKNISYKELTRASNRQKTTMNIGGLIGIMTIKNLNKECYEVLRVGELIALGKQTVFGLGKIRIKERNE